ncbi:hypothetical protein PKO51_06535 [Yokenella regensburgei]|uniref:hypothetical protein n=1 Tax=Yokenella regensburgei TaxID=158877 RepID=UPI0027D99865|nr:hypothetical protein [Yokenella regensburgei]MDQ4429032.1 hypothetical protein [Yokenella regensburgei]
MIKLIYSVLLAGATGTLPSLAQADAVGISQIPVFGSAETQPREPAVASAQEAGQVPRDTHQPGQATAPSETDMPAVSAPPTAPAALPPPDGGKSLGESVDALERRVRILEAGKAKAEEAYAPVSEEEREAYSVGLMVSQYAARVRRDMGMAGIPLDAATIEKGIRDGLAGRPGLQLSEAQGIITGLEARMTKSVSGKEEESRRTLNEIARTRDTVSKGEGVVWVSRKKGQGIKKTPTVITVEGGRYQGARFGGPREVVLKNRSEMNEVIRKAATLTGEDGIVELYALAGRVDKALLPADDIAPWEIVHITFTAFTSGQSRE